jgi:hypothetical protein
MSGNIGLMIQTYHVVIVLLISAGIDYVIGDPWGWPHPVQAMGWAIRGLSKFILNCLNSPKGDRPVFGLRGEFSWRSRSFLAVEPYLGY